MNIWNFDIDPQKTAEQMCDRDICGAAYTYTRAACDAHHVRGLTGRTSRIFPRNDVNDPAVIWLTTRDANYVFFMDLLRCVWSEYHFRYGKKHACSGYRDALWDPPGLYGTPSAATCPPLDLPLKYRSPDGDTWLRSFDMNRAYYIQEKPNAKWRRRPIPSWYAAGHPTLDSPDPVSLPVAAPVDPTRTKFLFKKIKIVG